MQLVPRAKHNPSRLKKKTSQMIL